MISQIIKAAQVNFMQCQWSIKRKMLLRIYKALLLTLFVPFAFSWMIWRCTAGQASNSKQKSGCRKQQSVLGRKLSNRCLLLFHCCPVSGDCKGKLVNKTACWYSWENSHQTLQLHAALFTARWCLFLILVWPQLGWFTVMTGRTISGSETTSCSLCRVTMRLTVISWAGFLQVDAFYYKH